METIRSGIIADDLTGAADTGIQFAKRDFYTILLPFGLENIESTFRLHEAQVVVLNTSTRGMQAELAYDTVRNATELLMRTLHPRNIYKKIDSTLRGNVGAEIEAVMHAMGNETALLAPAFPDCNRTTVGGIHLVNGQPLSRTEAAFDPVNPVDESHVPTLIRAQTGLKVGHIHLEEVRHGSRSLQRSIFRHVKDGEKIIVLDATTDDELSNIAEAGISMSSPPLMVGSAGLANQFSRLLKGFDTASSTQPKRRENADRVTISTTSTIQKAEGAIIIISGSLSAVTSRQLDEIRRTRRGKIIPIEVHRLIEDQKDGLSLSSDEVKEQESRIVSEIISAAEESAVDLKHETRDLRRDVRNSEVSSLKNVVGVQLVRRDCYDGQNTELRRIPRTLSSNEVMDSPLLVVEYLGRIALQIAGRCPQPIRGLILTGGDTALAVFKHLGISHVRLIDEILPGIPYGQVLGGEFAGLSVVTKAGAFGDESALVKCIDFLS
jgi:uncharacterized protein YgbK (DUF1537 family)